MAAPRLSGIFTVPRWLAGGADQLDRRSYSTARTCQPAGIHRGQIGNDALGENGAGPARTTAASSSARVAHQSGTGVMVASESALTRSADRPSVVVGKEGAVREKH